MIRFGNLMSDQPDHENPGASVANNVLPLTAQSYGPLAGLAAISDAVTNRVQGAIAAKDNAGNVFTFAADSDDLFRLNGTSWTNVSKSAQAYSVDSERMVQFAVFGNRVVAAMGIADPLQTFVMGTDSAFSDLDAAAPRARHVAVIRDHLMVGNTFDGTDGAQPQRVWFSAIGDPTDWPTIGSADAASKQSDRRDIRYGGAVQRIIGAVGGLDGAIFMETAIYRVIYTGPPGVFRITDVERQRGTPAPYSVVNVGRFAFYLGEDDFYLFDGSGSRPLGAQRIAKSFFAELDQNYFYRVVGAADPINKMVFWIYPGSGNTDGEPNRIAVYNWDIDRWSFGDVTQQYIFEDLTEGYNLDNADSLGNVDNAPHNPDSRAWTAGRLVLSAFDADKKLARYTGSTLEATLETGETGGNDFIFVDGVRPYIDGGTVTVTLRHRNSPSGSVTDDGPNAVGSDGMAHFTREARYLRAQCKIAAGGSWGHAQGVDLVGADGGTL